MGHQIANKISGSAPAATSAEHDAVAEKIAAQLKGAKRPLIVAGSSNGSELIKAAANIARALHEDGEGAAIDLCLLVPEVNSIGMGLMAAEKNSLGVALDKLSSGACEARYRFGE